MSVSLGCIKYTDDWLTDKSLIVLCPTRVPGKTLVIFLPYDIQSLPTKVKLFHSDEQNGYSQASFCAGWVI